jgi:hypothetical protein
MKGSIVMARVAGGKDVLEQPRDLLVNTRKIEESSMAMGYYKFTYEIGMELGTIFNSFLPIV